MSFKGFQKSVIRVGRLRGGVAKAKRLTRLIVGAANLQSKVQLGRGHQRCCLH